MISLTPLRFTRVSGLGLAKSFFLRLKIVNPKPEKCVCASKASSENQTKTLENDLGLVKTPFFFESGVKDFSGLGLTILIDKKQ